MDPYQLPVPHGLEETDRHRRICSLLLPQGLCLSPVLDRPQGPLHGRTGWYQHVNNANLFGEDPDLTNGS